MKYRPQSPRGRLLTGLAASLLLSCGGRRTLRPPPTPRIDSEEIEGSLLDTLGRDVRAAPARLWDDTKAVYSDGTNLALLLGASAYAIAHEHLFEDQEAASLENHTIYGSDVQDALAWLGNGLVLLGGASIWYVTAVSMDEREGYEASKTVLSALTVTSLSTLVLKATVPDGRPGGGPNDFPSGHSSLAMATAASLGGLYGPKIGIPSYVLAVMVGLQRIDTRKHDSAAVLFGWTLGYVVGHTVTHREPPKVLGLRVGPWVDPETGALGLSLHGGL